MKGKELVGYLLENPDWDVEFCFMQAPDEIDEAYDRSFAVVDVADQVDGKITVLIGEEWEKNRRGGIYD